MLPIDLSSVDLPILHRHLRENIEELYSCRNEDDKALIFKDKAISVTNEIHRRWLLNI